MTTKRDAVSFFVFPVSDLHCTGGKNRLAFQSTAIQCAALNTPSSVAGKKAICCFNAIRAVQKDLIYSLQNKRFART